MTTSKPIYLTDTRFGIENHQMGSATIEDTGYGDSHVDIELNLGLRNESIDAFIDELENLISKYNQ